MEKTSKKLASHLLSKDEIEVLTPFLEVESPLERNVHRPRHRWSAAVSAMVRNYIFRLRVRASMSAAEQLLGRRFATSVKSGLARGKLLARGLGVAGPWVPLPSTHGTLYSIHLSIFRKGFFWKRRRRLIRSSSPWRGTWAGSHHSKNNHIQNNRLQRTIIV